MTIWNRVETGCMAVFAAVAIVTLSGTVVRAAIIGFEAESGTLGAEFDPAIEDATASGGAYITTDSNSYEGGLSTAQPNSNKWTASYSLTVPTGTYDVYIRGRVGPGADNDDSFYYAKAFGDADPTGGSTVWQTENGIGSKDVPSYAEGFGAWSSALTSTVESPGGTVQWKIGAREFGFDIDAFAFVTSGQSVTDAALDAAVAASRGELTLFSETVASLTTSNATLTATLGGDDADVTLYWVAGAVGDPSAFSGWDGTNGSSAELEGSVVSLVASNLQADTFYSFAFYATNSTSGLEGWSESAATFITSLGSDQAPVFTSAVPDAASITLGWSDAATHETGFILQRSMNASPFETVTVASSNVVSYTDTGLLPNTAYDYRLAATNANNGSATDFSLCTTNVTTLPVQVGGPKETYSTAGVYYYKVASGFSEITIKSWGAGGGGGGNDSIADAQRGGDGGGGGYAEATYDVTAGDVLKVTVGAGGAAGAKPIFANQGGGGGGFSSVENLSVSEILIVAGGGGGGGGADEDDNAGAGGPGGGLVAAAGVAGDITSAGDQGGAGGGDGGNTTIAAGGIGGAVSGAGSAGANGASLSGGDGGIGRRSGTGGGAAGGLPGGGAGGGELDNYGDEQNGGGGGGSGYFGGGGGGGADDNRGGGGGGGGSSYTGSGADALNMGGSLTNAANTSDEHYADDAGQGGRGRGASLDSTTGNDGLVVIEVIPPAGTVVVIK